MAGLLAGLALTLVALLLRVAAGVPLPVELASDRIIPTLGVRTFGRLLGRVGGPLRGKNLAFLTSFGIQLAAAAAGGMLFGLLWPRLEGEGRRGFRRPGVLVGAALALMWVAATALLWPALQSNYEGLTPGWSRLATAAGLLATFEAYAIVLPAAWGLLRPRPPSPSAEPPPGTGRLLPRRALLAGGAGLLAGVAASGLAGLVYRRASFGAFGYDGLQLRGPRIDPVTPNDRFYVVTKNLIDPRPSDRLWRLQVTGLVEHPRAYSLEELVRLPAVRQEQTLECISNRVGSGLISNAVWTGVPLAVLLQAAGPRPGVRRVAMHASDGYVHTISADKAMEPTTLVAHRMNGRELPLRHGYPARVLVPGTYGEVSVKWVDRIELSAQPIEGYYERQGWKPYFVNTMSRIDSPRSGQRIPAGGGPVAIRGVAFAGDRGISKVEVSVDGGRTWSEARITYGPSKLAWVLWEVGWTPNGPGRYRISVRATDGLGATQTPKAHGAVPAGATGWHTVAVEVAG